MKENTLFSGISSADLANRKKKAQPSFIKPMLATLTTTYFSKADWIYEHKFDGERCIAVKRNKKVHLFSRNHRIINNEYPELVHAFEKQKADNFIVDGEIIALNKKGISDFEMLQSRINLSNPSKLELRQKNTPVSFAIFDCLYAGGYDLMHVPLLARKKILKKLLKYNSMLTYTPHKVNDGITYFRYACRHRWEGLIAKKADGHYQEAVRSKAWLKFKCASNQELVIGGYTTPRGARSDFGALMVGYYKKGTLHYAGKVGTGYSYETQALLGKAMRRIASDRCPFVDYDASLSNVNWIKPLLVAEFEFAQWTNNGKLRVGRYKGLRTDKKAKDVVREVAKSIAKIT